MGLLEDLKAQAKKLQKTIALPEADDERTLRAAAGAAQLGLGPVVLLGERDKIAALAKAQNIDIGQATVRDPATDPERDDFIQQFYELRKAKGVTLDKAATLISDPMYFAAMMVKLGKADGYVSGAVHSTADTCRPALQIIKTAKGINTVSSFFIMILPESSPYHRVNDVLLYADSGLVINPSVEELADIAITTAASFKALLPNRTPNIAFLSFSTKGSAKHELIDKTVAATKRTQERAPELNIDGELQVDAALIEAIGQRKAPGSSVAGRANILIFPDLQAGNIAYKLTERLAGATAIGPVLQGLAKPVNDLSRGCKFEDIIDTIALTACQC
ncbi:phosphotransacetylase [Planctomycetales bacterium]|nr:phosphotransacetylase [Planctomycetales bacterium]GHT06274.1 phosphotransacetylase [Planctomycetales bacterium]